MIAVETEDAESFESLLSAGADVNMRTAKGDAALLIALRKRLPDTAARLLEKGADPLVRSADGNTGLHYAAEMNNKSLAEQFIAAGVAISGVNGNGETPLHIALSRAEALILPFLKARASIRIADKIGVPLFFAYCVRGYFENCRSISDLKSTEKTRNENDLIQAFKNAFKDSLFAAASSTETESKNIFAADKKEETDWVNACVREAEIDLSLFNSNLLNKELTAYLESIY